MRGDHVALETLANGQAALWFLHKDRKHPQTINELGAKINQAVVKKLVETDQYKKHVGTKKELEQLEKDLADNESQIAYMTARRVTLVHEQAPGLAKALVDHDEQVAALNRQQDGIRQQINILKPIFAESTKATQVTAQGFATEAANSTYRDLTNEEMKIAAEFEKNAAPLIGKLVQIHQGIANIHMFSSPKLGETWLREALAAGK